MAGGLVGPHHIQKMLIKYFFQMPENKPFTVAVLVLATTIETKKVIIGLHRLTTTAILIIYILIQKQVLKLRGEVAAILYVVFKNSLYVSTLEC